MSYLLRKFVVLSFVICFVGVGFGISGKDADRITSAGPDKASAQPKAARKVLVFTLCKGFKHKSIPYCSKAMEVLGSKTGAFSCDVSKDMKVFTAENLAQYDAIIFNNTTKLTFDDAQRQALMGFIKGGKGIVGIHAATDNFYKWPEAAEMMGGQFAGHPWRAKGTWAVKIEDCTHPVTAAFKCEDFKVNDEIYRTKYINLRKNSRVLVGLDMTDEVNLNAKGVKSSDVDIAISWVRDFGKGRLFYCSFGHNKEIFWNKAILKHYFDGIQFALGDLEVDTTPLPSQKDWADIAGLLDSISDYKSGESRLGLVAVENAVKAGVVLDERSLEVEKAMRAFLLSDATVDSKQFVCRQLGLIGTEASAEVLGQLLVKDETSDMARYALERIPGSVIDNVLLNGLDKTSGKAKVGIVNSIGVRGMNSAVKALSVLADADDKQLKTAAISALGRIGSLEAGEVLAGLISKGSDVDGLAEMSYLQCADKFVGEGKKAKALEIYRKLSQTSSYDPVRRAGFIGLVEVSDDPSELLISTLDSKDSVLQHQAAVMADMIKGTGNIKTAAEKISTLPANVQAPLLFALADTGDAVILPVVLESVRLSDVEVHMAAIKALKLVGNAYAAGMLANIAAKTGGREQAEARRSLYGMRGERVDEALVRLLGNADTKLAMEVVAAVRERRIASAVDALAELTASKNILLARAAVTAIGEVGTAKDVDKLVGLLVDLKNEHIRPEAEIALVVLCRRTGLDEGISKVVLALKKTKRTMIRHSLYKVLGRSGASEALSVLRNTWKHPKPSDRHTLIQALSLWPDNTTTGDLLEIVKTRKNATSKDLALRGFLKLVMRSKDKPEEKFEMLKEAMEICTSSKGKRIILLSMSSIASVESLQLIAGYLDDAPARTTAALAILKMAGRNNLKKNQKEMKVVLTKMAGMEELGGYSEQAKEMLDKIK